MELDSVLNAVRKVIVARAVPAEAVVAANDETIAAIAFAVMELLQAEADAKSAEASRAVESIIAGEATSEEISSTIADLNDSREITGE